MKIFRNGPYEGPVCYVDRDQKNAAGRKLEAGWHYSTRQHRKYGEIPQHKLHLNDSDPENPYYEYAKKYHKSWLDKHGESLIVTIGER